jgi:two-component system LytT family response regulator
VLRSVIVDDEAAARGLLAEILQKRDDVEIVGSYGDSRRAIVGIRSLRPDIVFLDIQMPGSHGFEILEALGSDAPPVIFVTAYDSYAIQAFEIAAIDYVLKPLDEERVFKAVDRAIQQLSAGKSRTDVGAIAELMSALKIQQQGHLRYVPIKVRDRTILLRADDISWIEAEGKYVRIHAGDARHLVRRTMASLESALDPVKFLRVSRSAIVNIEHVSHLEPWGQSEWMIALKSGEHVISKHGYKEGLKKLLRQS